MIMPHPRPWPLRGLAAALALTAAGCATHQGEPVIKTVTVEVAVPIQCPDKRLPEQAYPDTPEAIRAAPDILAIMKLVLAGRVMRIERLLEDDAAIKACALPK